MTEYVLAPEAERDLGAIWEYIAGDNLEAADGWIAKLFDTFEVLARMPGIGHARPDLTSQPVLFWPLGAYLIIYQAQRSRVEIVAVTQAARDIPVFLNQRT